MEIGLDRICPHCGAPDTRRLGECSVCSRKVCERCGSVQFSSGSRKVLHSECLRSHGGGFKMIKLLK